MVKIMENDDLGGKTHYFRKHPNVTPPEKLTAGSPEKRTLALRKGGFQNVNFRGVYGMLLCLGGMKFPSQNI